MISFQPTVNLQSSAEITFENMRSYYEHYAVDWALPQVLEQITSLENWDILYDQEVIGAIRLAFDEEGCYLRDLQICEPFQNKRIGASAIAQCEQWAIKAEAKHLRLRVFKISPAHHLYKRVGFIVEREEDRFYYMSKTLCE